MEKDFGNQQHLYLLHFYYGVSLVLSFPFGSFVEIRQKTTMLRRRIKSEIVAVERGMAKVKIEIIETEVLVVVGVIAVGSGRRMTAALKLTKRIPR